MRKGINQNESQRPKDPQEISAKNEEDANAHANVEVKVKVKVKVKIKGKEDGVVRRRGSRGKDRIATTLQMPAMHIYLKIHSHNSVSSWKANCSAFDYRRQNLLVAKKPSTTE